MEGGKITSMEKFKKLIRMLIAYPKRFISRTSFRATVIDSRIDSTTRVDHHANVRYSSVGRYTMVASRSSIVYSTVGAFSSIAAEVGIGGGAHNVSAVSSSNLFEDTKNGFGVNFGRIPFSPFKETKIGNDVWIGNSALIMQGITVGDGAVIGAGSIVTKDVEPYTIVAGNPARVIRKRFSDEEIEKLIELQWWNKSEEWLHKYGNYFSSPETLFKKLEEAK